MRRSLGRTALSFAAVVAFVVAALLPGAIAYVTDLRATDAHLRRALDELRDADLRAALGSLLHAEIAATQAAEASTSPLQRAGMRIGPLADDAAGLDALLTAARDVSAAGIDFIGASGIDRLADVYRNSAFDLEAIDRVALAAGSLRGDLLHAGGRLEDATIASDSFVGRRVTKTLVRLQRLSEGLERGATFMEMVPAFMGANAERRYLLALQSPSEARGGGGLIGVYGVLSFDDGRLELEHVGPVEELLPERARRIDAPRWFVEAYGSFGALRGDMRQANLSPNFPPTARVMLDTYETSEGERLDGVIALDPLAIGELLRGTGPLRAPGWHREITRGNVRRTLLHDIYRHFDYREREQNGYLRGLIASFMDALSAPDLEVGGLIRGLGIASARQHLKIFATDPFVQERIVELGVHGDYRQAGEDVQVVFNNNFSASKVDFFLKRMVVTDVRLRADGSARVVVSVALTNEAGSGKTVLVRPLNPALPFGTNHMLLGLIAPSGADPGAVTAAGRTVIQVPRMDADRPLTLQAAEVAPGATENVVYRYDWSQAWDPVGGRFSLTLWPQATVRADFFTLTVTGPPSVTWKVPPGWRLSGPSLVTTGRLHEPFRGSLRMSGN